VARRTFHVATSDYTEATLLPALLTRLGREAPGVDVTVLPSKRDSSSSFEDSGVDLAIGPRVGESPAVVRKHLFHEDFVCFARRGHPLTRGRGKSGKPSLERFLSYPQVAISPFGTPGSPVDDALARAGHQRRIALRVPSFLVAPLVVATSDLVGFLPARLARQVARLVPLVIMPTPLPLDGFDIAMTWHERFAKDAGHAWFRRVVEEVAATT
jgi:DNA-binding transcriptional LysR family regulator